jgi:hypothetical protein
MKRKRKYLILVKCDVLPTCPHPFIKTELSKIKTPFGQMMYFKEHGNCPKGYVIMIRYKLYRVQRKGLINMYIKNLMLIFISDLMMMNLSHSLLYFVGWYSHG